MRKRAALHGAVGRALEPSSVGEWVRAGTRRLSPCLGRAQRSAMVSQLSLTLTFLHPSAR